jgi:uncharacterized protein YciI
LALLIRRTVGSNKSDSWTEDRTMLRRNILLPILVMSIAMVFVARAYTQTKPHLFVGVFKVKSLDFLKNGPKPEEMPIIKKHMEYWQKLTDNGICLIAGHTLNDDESAFGLVVVRTGDQSVAQKMVDDDPMVLSGTLTVKVFPFEGLQAKRSQTESGSNK